jgi:hypothetical protein
MPIISDAFEDILKSEYRRTSEDMNRIGQVLARPTASPYVNTDNPFYGSRGLDPSIPSKNLTRKERKIRAKGKATMKLRVEKETKRRRTYQHELNRQRKLAEKARPKSRALKYHRLGMTELPSLDM